MSAADQAPEQEREALTLPLRVVLDGWRDGEEHGWQTEFDWIESNHSGQIDMLTSSIQQDGIRVPILLGNDGRVWDGHHRLCAANRLALESVPVEVAGWRRPAPEQESRLARQVRLLADEHDAYAAEAEAIADDFEASGSDPDEDPIYSNRQSAAEHRQAALRLRSMLDSAAAAAPEQEAVSEEVIDAACEVLHDAYESAASTVGWETQPRSRVPWPEVPAENAEAMRSAVRVLLSRLPHLTRSPAEVWVAIDNGHVHGVTASKESAQAILDDYLAQFTKVTVSEDGWYEPQQEGDRDGSWFKRFYDNPLIVRGSTLRHQEIRRYEVQGQPAEVEREVSDVEAITKDEVREGLRSMLVEKCATTLDETDLEHVLDSVTDGAWYLLRVRMSALAERDARVEREVRERIAAEIEAAATEFLAWRDASLGTKLRSMLSTREVDARFDEAEGMFRAARIARSIGGETGGAS
ncbi:MAG: ParB N-terminal domain-containing protein [Aeromicrobium erythreum]